MLGANFFYKLFNQKGNKNHELVKYNENEKYDFQNQINIKIIEVDRKISENNKALLEAQIVKLRSTIKKTNNFVDNIEVKFYQAKLEESINWHQKQLKELYYERKQLQIQLEKIKGIFWLNRIKRFITIIFIGFFILLSLFIFLSGFMIIIYLMPLIILIFLVYWIANSKH